MVQTTTDLYRPPVREHHRPSNARGLLPRDPRYVPTTDFQRRVYCLLGLPIDAISMDAAVERIMRSVDTGQRCFLSTPNLNFLIGTQKDKAFRESVVHSDLSVADGMPLVWIARSLGIPIRERVAGSNLFEELRRKSRKSMSVYFFGGADSVAAAANKELNAHPSALVGAGAQFPGFGSIEDMSKPTFIEQINSSAPDFLVVAMGAKKGQAWIKKNLIKLNVPVISHLGAVVNFVAGSVSRAPLWMQKTGCEWVWRIKEEPTLWKRYFFDGVVFTRLMLTHILPCAIRTRLASPSATHASTASCLVTRHATLCNVRLSGAWLESNLSPLRDAFSEVTSMPVNIRIDFSEVNYVDAACVGLLTLLYGHQTQTGRGLSIVFVSNKVRRLFKLYGAGYILERLPNA